MAPRLSFHREHESTISIDVDRSDGVHLDSDGEVHGLPILFCFMFRYGDWVTAFNYMPGFQLSPYVAAMLAEVRRSPVGADHGFELN